MLHLLACTPTPPDAEPFRGVLVQLDADKDGRVTVDEYPAAPPAGAKAAEVDRDDDGVISAAEVRDEVYASDPSGFDKMAWKRSGRDAPTEGGSLPSERSVTGYKPPQGPLAEALRFLDDLASTRRPDLPPLGPDALDAAAAAGMTSEAGAVVLARLQAAGVDLPVGLATAPADPVTARAPLGSGPPPGEETLRSAGPGGRDALRGRAGGGKSGTRGQPPGGRGPGGHPPGGAGAPPHGRSPPPQQGADAEPPPPEAP